MTCMCVLAVVAPAFDVLIFILQLLCQQLIMWKVTVKWYNCVLCSVMCVSGLSVGHAHFAGKPSCILTYVGLLLLFVVFPCVHETCVQCAFLLKVRSNYVEAYVCVYSI
jgi:hypothetical protein